LVLLCGLIAKVKLEVKLATLPASSQSCNGCPYATRPLLQIVSFVRSIRSLPGVASDMYLMLALLRTPGMEKL
jgi:hypothetical protein